MLEGESIVGMAIQNTPALWCIEEPLQCPTSPPVLSPYGNSPLPSTETLTNSSIEVPIRDWREPIRKMLQFENLNINIRITTKPPSNSSRNYSPPSSPLSWRSSTVTLVRTGPVTPLPTLPPTASPLLDTSRKMKSQGAAFPEVAPSSSQTPIAEAHSPGPNVTIISPWEVLRTPKPQGPREDEDKGGGLDKHAPIKAPDPLSKHEDTKSLECDPAAPPPPIQARAVVPRSQTRKRIARDNVVLFLDKES
jgi:hypothetical protein